MKLPLFSALALAAAMLPTTAPAATVVKTLKTVAPAANAHAGEFLAPFSTVYAQVRFTDTGSSLNIQGRGVGFQAGLAYTSFFYGTGSVPRGALACFPPTPNNLTALQMITGYWLPTTSTRRTLVVQKTGTSYVSLFNVSTFSVRYDSTPNLPLTSNLNPGRFWLDSCGMIR